MQIVTFFEGLIAPFYAMFSNPDPSSNFGALCVLSVVVISILGIFLKILKEA